MSDSKGAANKSLLGQLIAEIGRFGGFDNKQASQLATVLLPFIDQYSEAILAQEVNRIIGEDEDDDGVSDPAEHYRNQLRDKLRRKAGLV